MPPFPVPGTPAECVHRQRYRSTRHRRRDRRTSRLRALDGPVGSPRPSGPGHDRSDPDAPRSSRLANRAPSRPVAARGHHRRVRDRCGPGCAGPDRGRPDSPAVARDSAAALADAKLRAEETVRTWSRADPGRPCSSAASPTCTAPGRTSSSRRAWCHTCRGTPRRSGCLWTTLRDYLFAPDAAGLVLDAMDRLRADAQVARSSGDGAPVVIKVLATQRAITGGRSSRSCAASSGADQPSCWARARRAPSRRATSASPRACGPSFDDRVLTTFPAGVEATLRDLQRRQQIAPEPARRTFRAAGRRQCRRTGRRARLRRGAAATRIPRLWRRQRATETAAVPQPGERLAPGVGEGRLVEGIGGSGRGSGRERQRGVGRSSSP